MSEKQALFEVINPGSAQMITESDGKEFMYLKGLFIQGEYRNHNGRIYPHEEIAKAVSNLNSRIEELKKRSGPMACIAGELDHPDSMNINFDRISHGITEMRLVGNDGHGTMRIMNEGLGRVAKGAMEIGIPVGVSSRGSGNVGGDGRVSDYDIVTIDLVINPSAPDAYPRMSLSESLNRSKSGQEIKRLSDFVREDRSAQKFLQAEVTNFLKQLVNKI